MALQRPLLMQAAGSDAAFSYSAQQHRQLIGALLSEGVGSSAALKVTQRALGANFTVDVAAGPATVAGDSVANQGTYYILNDAPITDTAIPAAPASGTRVHRVVLKVRDHAHDGAVPAGTYEARVEVLEDTGTGTPAVPASAIPLARVTVTSTTTSITDANITDDRAVWRFAGDEWVTYVPAWTATTTNPDIGNGTISGRFRRLGSTVHVQIYVQTGSTTTYGSGTYRFSLPVVPRSTQDQIVPAVFRLGTYYGNGSALLTAGSLQAQLLISNDVDGDADQASPTSPQTWAAGASVIIQGVYEAA
jgi:hypothetical protein